jgi:hypothetical protein
MEANDERKDHEAKDRAEQIRRFLKLFRILKPGANEHPDSQRQDLGHQKRRHNLEHIDFQVGPASH